MRPDRRLGQHFLRDIDVLQDIASLADVGRSSGVLEIGPGEGALTAFLVEAGKPVVAIDKDPRALSEIAQRFGDRVTGVLGDAVDDDLGALLPLVAEDGTRPVVVGNLPYNVASLIFRRLLLLGPTRVSRMVLMFQREVALRIVAEPGNKTYGVPSIIANLTARCHLVRAVPPQAFYPPPKVQSAVILVEPRAEALHDLNPAELEAFGRWIPTVFQKRRKKLRHATAAITDFDAAIAAGIDMELRPERLGPQEILTLFLSQRLTAES